MFKTPLFLMPLTDKATSFFTCGDTNVTTTKVYVVSATLGTTTVTKRFTEKNGHPKTCPTW